MYSFCEQESDRRASSIETQAFVGLKCSSGRRVNATRCEWFFTGGTQSDLQSDRTNIPFSFTCQDPSLVIHRRQPFVVDKGPDHIQCRERHCTSLTWSPKCSQTGQILKLAHTPPGAPCARNTLGFAGSNYPSILMRRWLVVRTSTRDLDESQPKSVLTHKAP